MEPNISRRVHIAWWPDPPSEPTNTLVLTSRACQYVDIRILMPPEGQTTALPNQGEPIPPVPRAGMSDPSAAVHESHEPVSSLEWAFAGTSSSHLVTDEGDYPFVRSTWEHWIDSKTDSPVRDQGDMWPEEDGVHTMEYGEMTNPATGLLTRYEERWADDEVLTSDYEDGERVCVVLKLHSPEHHARGMIIRVGHLCQGILKVGSELSCERWRYATEHSTGDSPAEKVDEAKHSWKREVKMGRFFLPCAATFDVNKFEPDQGDRTVEHGEYKWHFTEIETW
ncbi:hypothetical protein LTR66_010782 [Elasticomyces elasticus]|nr:hypothetical protein LTR28_007382 [Elasticomyces elasticus]KAK4977301.1 hypothetical protein LTR66_010782 [Elasticomyces elasticus]